jgi:hypothetical protein
MSNLFERAEAIRARYKVLESVPGSGFHDADLDHRGQPIAPQKRGLPAHSGHLVMFDDEYEFVFAGADALMAKAELDAWYEAHASTDVNALNQLTGTQRKLLSTIPKQKIQTRDGETVLAVNKSVWNEILEALYDQGVGVSGAPYEVNAGS